jgi:3-isopropylmalate/(R)-2-methylmalate dehydratase small subunit
MTAFEPIGRITAVAAPLLRDNVDTDAIIPSREMKSTGKTGLADGLFAGWRYIDAGSRTPRANFVLNQTAFAAARILVSGRNFGSGSSREHAVWALAEFGIRAIVAISFAPIFFGNCIRNGILPVALPEEAVMEIAAAVSANPSGALLTIDLPRQIVKLPDGRTWRFPIGGEAKAMLLEGLDGIDLTLKHRESIEAFVAADRLARPWIYIGDGR